MAGLVTLAAFGYALTPHPALAQAMRQVTQVSADCRSLISPNMRGTVQAWQAYVWLEHCDRIKRLMKLSALLPPAEQPVFFEGVVPMERLPAEFHANIPVLRVVFPERTFFDTARSDLRPEAETVAGIVAGSLRNEPPDVAMFVAGHADQRGDRSLNERLSIDRADSIAQRIFRGGVASSSIWRVGFGADMPLVAGSSSYAYDRNRRVEFLFAAKPEAVGVWLADQQLDELCQARTSIEVARCKARLDFRPDYEAVEISTAPRTPVAPAPPPHHRVRPAPKSRVALEPAPKREAPVNPGHSAMIELSLNGPRKMHLDPRSHRVAPTSLDL